MYVKRVAVVSQNPTFIRFFELECRLLHCEVQAFSKMPHELAQHVRVFIDTDTIRSYLFDRDKVVTVSKNASLENRENHLCWPPELDQIRALLTDAPMRDSMHDAPAQKEVTLQIQSRERREISYGARSIILSQTEFMLFEVLASAQNKPVSRHELMTLFGAEKGNIADVYVCLLRKKLEQLCECRVIETVRGVGYRWMLSVEDEAEKK